MYAIDKRRCRLVKRQGITGRTEAADRNVLIRTRGSINTDAEKFARSSMSR